MTDEQTWTETVARLYREAVAEAGEQGGQRQDAFMVASARVETEIRAGRLIVPTETVIRAELLKADESDGRRADSVLRTAATGQASLVEPDLDLVVTLGRGRRKPWRWITRDDLREMDVVRFENVRAVQDSYAEWRTYYDTALAVLFQYPTFGEAVEAGGFEVAVAS